jgi:signal transduction histidine kinase
MNKRKIKSLRNRTIIITIIIIAIIGGLRTYDDVKRNQEILLEKEDKLRKNINNIYKQELDKISKVLSLNLSIITSSNTAISIFKNKNRENLYKFSKPFYDSIKKVLNTKTIMHYHDKGHISFLRIHKKQINSDNLELVRPMVTYAIDNEKITSGYEHGKHDYNTLTYRMVYPIFDKSVFLGALEIGIDTSYINKKIETILKNLYGIDGKIINMIKEDTINFDKLGDFTALIDGYRYRNNDFINLIFKNADDSINPQTVKIDEKIYSLQLSDIELLNSKQKIIGNYFYIIDISDDIKQNKIFFFSSLAKPVIAAILIVILIFFVFHYFYKNFLILEKRTRTILDGQSSLVILSNGNRTLDINKTALEFYNKDSLSQFSEEYPCISDSFIEGTDLLQKYNADGLSWIEQLQKKDSPIYKVAIRNEHNEINFFTIALSTYDLKKEESNYYVITLTNISELELVNSQLVEQSKHASLGEMIGNISHQWRQPLSAISSIASGIKLEYHLDKNSLDHLPKKMDMVVTKANYLSQTIDTFRNFIKEKKERKTVVLQDRIELALQIVESTLVDKHIKLIKDIDYNDKVMITLVLGELSQVIINIINNAKDAILDNNIQDGYIKLSLNTNDKEEAVIIIEDNGGGIEENVLKQIFEPYFTTKHQSQGTGLGLYMSYKIIVESLKGKLYAQNTQNGAKFIIKLPLKKDL